MLARTTLSAIAACLFPAVPGIVTADSSELMVCLAYSETSDQVSCCDEFGISEADCIDTNRRASDSNESQSENDSYFYCRFHDLDGSGLDIARWGKGTDFKFVPSKNMWVWRTEYTVQSIDSNGGYYQRALDPMFNDQIGECGLETELAYKRRVKEIMEEYRK